jgi:Na+/citrate or Na+/malate symporter
VLREHGTNVFAEMKKLPDNGIPSLQTKLIAGTSLSMWIAVLVCGRLLTFFRPPFFH